nr:hypothetical protein [Tanacetum cinerariifolium]
MSNKILSGPQAPETNLDQPLYTPIKRRSFFMYAGATAGATALVLAGCKKDDENSPGVVSLGNGNLSVLNYAYALEQLEAAFYAQVVKTPATDFKAGELAYFTQVAAHEAIHRDFLKAAIINVAKASPIQDLTPNFSSITFTSRASVLATAQAFEDLGVAAYNGAGKLISASDSNGATDLTLAPEQQYNVGLTIIEPDGSFHTEELPDNFYSYTTKEKVAATVTSENTSNLYVNRRNRYARNLLLQKELLKIKELTAQGWTLTSTVPDKFGVRYIFQKPALQ